MPRVNHHHLLVAAWALLCAAGVAADADAQQCVPNATSLCLNDGRFRVSAEFAPPGEPARAAQGVQLTGDTGYFWFFNADNVEIVTKVLNGCPVNQRFWVFAAGLTNVETTLTVEDLVADTVQTYENPPFTAFQPIQDTSAFATCSEAAGEALADGGSVAAAASWAAADVAALLDGLAAPALGPESVAAPGGLCNDTTGLCLNGERFHVTARWRTVFGTSGSGKPVQLTDDTGYFWFFNADNVEAVVKVLDGCPLNQRFWVFAAGLTNVEVILDVEDLQTNQVRTYTNPLGESFQPILDTAAFDTCNGGGGGVPLKDDTVLPLPTFRVQPSRPAGGTAATATVERPGASAISLTATGPGCGGFGSHTGTGGRLDVIRTVSDFGACSLTAMATIGGDTETYRTRFEVEPVELLLPAVELLGGVFKPGDLPAPTNLPQDPDIAGVAAPGTLINGGTAQLRIALDNPALAGDVNRILVKVPGAAGFDGYFEAPVQRQGNELIAEIRLAPDFGAPGTRHAELRFASQEALLGGPFEILVQLVDFFGRIGQSRPVSFLTEQVGANDVQVSLSWDTPTDVDLHVVEPPPGTEIYYGNLTSPTGGELDLDSNPACNIDGVNNENVTWPVGAPIRGEHIVRVDYWSSCGGQSANYLVTTRVCGEVRTFTGQFGPGDADQGGAGSGVEVTRFTPTCSSRVRGKATYEDRAQTASGLSTTTTPLPIRFARIEVKRASDDATLATGSTKQDGTFDVSFQNDGPAGYYVVVQAQQDDTVVRQVVRNSSNAIYSQRSAGTIDETAEPDKADVEIKALATGSAPAFNIFDMGVVGAELYRRHHGVTPPNLNWLWTSGQPGSCGADVSCFQRSANRISVLSVAADRDEYDDLVLLHEYGHKWQYERSRSDSPGGFHSSRNRVDPQLAWGEGSATFFGNLAKGVSLYLDTIAAGIGVRLDIEALDGTIPLGTSDGTQSGNLSEAVVAAVLWDLADGTNETRDTLTSEAGVFSALSYLGSGQFADRGTTGADLVDALDGWFCRGNGNVGDANSGVRGNVVGIHQFPYDFATVPSCN